MSDRPNLVFILTDQWRAPSLGCMGNDHVRTPNIDSLAADGLVFENAYTPNPVCSPARASILTGRYPHSNRVIDNTYLRLPLPTGEVTISERFRDAGYATGYIGKWHLDGNVDGPGYVPPGERRRGFEYWKGFDRGHKHHTGHPHFAKDGTVEWEEGRQPDIQTDLAIDFIQDQQRIAPDRPFFLFVSWGPPHTPFEAPEEYGSLYETTELPLRRNVPAELAEEVREDLVEYYGMITWLDDNLGRLLHALEDLEIAGETIVVFTSDHGEMMGSHGLYNKGVPHEESVHVPLLVRYPDGIDAGRRSDAVVNLIDLLPTLSALCDVDVPDAVQGTDLHRHVLGESVETPDSTYIEGKLPFEDTWRALRTREHMLAIDGTLETRHLYDMRDDPYQQRNLANTAEAADLEADLRERLHTAAYEHDDRVFKARFGRNA